MYNDQRVIALIPARGGSKSIPNKNLKDLGGKPLLAWSIEVANATPEIDRVIVSTDDDQIAETAVQYGAEVIKRPAELAMDDSLVIDAIRHVIDTIEQEDTARYMVLLEPTSPLRLPSDVSKCIQLLHTYDSVATFTEAELNPHRAWKIDGDKSETFIPGANPWLPRQKLPQAYQLNGAVYAFHIPQVKEHQHHITIFTGHTGAVLMPRERSIDIDTALDFIVAEQLLKRDE